MSKNIAALLLAALFLLPSVCYSAIEVSINTDVFVTGQYITLGDIAQISGDDSVRLAVLKQIRLGSAPVPGSKAILSRDIINSRLLASQVDFGDVEWKMTPDFVTIISGGQVISGKTLSEAALTLIRSSLPKEDKAEYSVALLQEVSDIVAPLGIIEYGLLGKPSRLGTLQTAYLAVTADGVQFSKIPIKCEVRRFGPVLTTTQVMAARGAISLDSVRQSWLDTSRLPAGYLQDPAQAVGLVISRSLPIGSIIYSSYLEKPVLIKRGSPVLICVNVDGVEAAAPGIAQTDGREGQIISIRNSATGRVISARVLDKERVEVPVINK